MRRTLTLIPVIALAALVAACGQHQTIQHGARRASQQVDHAIAGLGHDPQVRQAESDLRQAEHDAGRDLHNAANETRDAARRLDHEAQHTSRPDAGHAGSAGRNG